MDKLLLTFLFFNVIAIGHSFNCTPKAKFQKDCNTCICNDLGNNAVCTLMACPDLLITTTEEPSITEQSTINGNQVCTPNEIKMQVETNETCNRCKCAANGIGWFCTKIVCPPRDIHTRSVRNTQECIPNTDWKEDCNTCFCTPTGLKACTRMACPEFPRTKREINENNCTPGQRWKKDCNDCFCTETGLAACTLRGCLGSRSDGHRSHHHQPRVLPSSIPVISRDELNRSDFHCTPHEYFKVDCNNCKCSSDGKMAKCTKKACDVQ
ncbi:hypothetical protein PVAND_009146 [Polypedilum vanderplanki]|uniref:Pacifastin domain-containing protein n=1 Tax=Polypedilum vanderplanki TaxID=319348 RepID=A0A9J6CC09_POLVA|nr:hypothetical protein PVAND_009146 [Polypedilum vanderplanki]